MLGMKASDLQESRTVVSSDTPVTNTSKTAIIKNSQTTDFIVENKLC